MPYYRVLVEKQFSVIVQADNSIMAKDAATEAVTGKTGQKSHVFDTQITVASVARLSIGLDVSLVGEKEEQV